MNLHVPRLGGAFGGKFFAANHVGLATAVAAYATGRYGLLKNGLFVLGLKKTHILSAAQGHLGHSFSSSGPMQVTKTQVKRWLTVLYTQHNQQSQTQLRQF